MTLYHKENSKLIHMSRMSKFSLYSSDSKLIPTLSNASYNSERVTLVSHPRPLLRYVINERPLTLNEFWEFTFNIIFERCYLELAILFLHQHKIFIWIFHACIVYCIVYTQSTHSFFTPPFLFFQITFRFAISNIIRKRSHGSWFSINIVMQS